MKQTDPQFKFRIPPELKSNLDAEAASNARTLGAEIVARLNESFELTMPLSDVDLDRMKVETRHRAEAEQMQRQIRSLEGSIEGYRRMLPVMEVTQQFLAGALVRAIDRLPESLRGEYANVRELAVAFEHNDPRGILGGMLWLLEGSTEVTDEVRKMVRDLEPAIAAKERGEDMTPYRKADMHKHREQGLLMETQRPYGVGEGAVMPIGKPSTAKPAKQYVMTGQGLVPADGPLKDASTQTRPPPKKRTAAPQKKH